MSDISLWVERLLQLGQGIFKGTWSSQSLRALQHAKEHLEGRAFIWRSLVEPETSALNIARRRISRHSSTDREPVEVRASVLTWLRWWSLSRAALLLETFVKVTASLSSSIPEGSRSYLEYWQCQGISQLISSGAGELLERENQEILMQNLRDCVMEESLGFRMSHLNGLIQSSQTPAELFWMSLMGRAAWPFSSGYWTDILSMSQSRVDLWNSEQDGYLLPASFVLRSIMEGMDNGQLFADDFEILDNASNIEEME